MKSKTNFFLKITILTILAGIFVTSCQHRPSGVLNATKMENLLFDMYVMEGSMSAAGIEYNDPTLKEKYYQSLLTKYDISKAEFDSSVSWYTKHPKFFERIYINVDNRLKQLTTDVEKRKFHPIDSNATNDINIWNLRTRYILTKDSTRTRLKFDIKSIGFLPGDYYILSLRHRIARTDTTFNPHMVMYVNYWDGTIDSIYTKTYNDNLTRRYKLMLKARFDRKIKSVSGMLLGYDSVRGKMNVYLDSIQLLRRFYPTRQDSIRDMVDWLDTTVIPVDTVPAAIPSNQGKKFPGGKFPIEAPK
ncbi:MAG TPA: DUF4296 domain-containing protein [Paludibacteraceae bacterium]|nr:DUF4296 domain-containing protein [Paludibacteraceae bacterium]